MARKFKRPKKKAPSKPIDPQFIRFKRWIMSLFSFMIVIISALTVYAKEESPGALNADIFNNEPSIYEIQQEAIEYAEVSPEKIEWMRRAARNKAWLPKFSVGFDTDMDQTIDLDRGSTSTADVYIQGPDEESWGADISLSWDFGELIWNNDQTNIDSRSHLMVRLRNGILDEVTKLYFKRRKLQFELFSNPPEDKEEILLKQLELDELTANIDAFTGGYLSKQIKSREVF